MQKVILFVLLLAPLVLAASVSFTGDQVLTLYVENEQQVEALERLEAEGLDIWSERWGVGAPVDVRVTPKQLRAFSRIMFDKFKTNYSIKLKSVQTEVDREQKEQAQHPSLSVLMASQNFKNDDFFAKYRTHEEFSQFWQHLHSQFPALTTLFEIGTTLNGKKIFGIKITGKNGKQAKPQMVFNGGQHAREWISPMTVAFIANSLLTKYESDSRIKKLVDELEWHLIPIVNIDGYEYTHAGHRMHRKNMRKNPGGCLGVDPNRNWDYQWNATGGSSTNPCSETYRGPNPFSEPESGAIGNYTIGLPNLRGYIDFHSYSQLWMRPWGFSKQPPAHEDRMKKIGDACSKAVKDTHGKNYASGRISIIIYEASGSSADFVYGKRPEATAFGVELRDTGAHGFILPVKEIVPTGEENLNAILVFGEHVLQGEHQ